MSLPVSALFMTKKPWPLIAMSRLASVNCRLPWSNCWLTLVSLTPLPTEVGVLPNGEISNRSPNSVREPLNPVVPTLAILLLVTLRSTEAACKPLSAVLNDIALLLVRYIILRT